MKQFLFLAFLLFSFLSFGQEDHYFYPFKDAEGWGVKRANGIELFPERYDAILISNLYAPYKNRIRVKKDGKWGVVDSFGVELIPIGYGFLETDEFGYTMMESDTSHYKNIGFLNLSGDTVVPLGHTFLSTNEINQKGDFLVQAVMDSHFEKYAIYSSDGVRRTEYEFDEIVEIDSGKYFTEFHSNIGRYFALSSLKTSRFGVYDGVNKRIVVPPVYDYICDTWCFLSPNPLNHPGPIVYTGSTPVFHVPKGEDLQLINVHGKKIFSSKDYIGWEEGKRYYVDENGDAREVVGELAVNYTGNDDPPYVMKDSEGYFFVDSTGTSLLEDKRFPAIVKYNHSSDKRREANVFVVSNESYQKSIFDYSLNERVPAKYVSIDFKDQNVICEKADGSYDFYDSLLTKLNIHSLEELNQPQYLFFSEDSTDVDLQEFGVKSKTGEIIVPPIYHRRHTVRDWDSKSNTDTTFYIFSDTSSKIDVYTEDFKKVMEFEGVHFKAFNRFNANRKLLIFLFRGTHMSIYDFVSKTWILRDVPSISSELISDFNQVPKEKYGVPTIEFFGNEMYFWIYSEQNGWTLYDELGEELLRWSRKMNAYPRILFLDEKWVFALQEEKIEGETRMYIANNYQNELVLDDEVADANFLTEMNSVFIRSRSNWDDQKMYSNELSFIEDVEGSVFKYSNGEAPFYLIYDKKSQTFKLVLPENGTNEGISNGTYWHFENVRNWIRSSEGLTAIRVDSSLLLISSKYPNSIVELKRPPHGLFRERNSAIFMCTKMSDYSNFYRKNGELLFEDYVLVKIVNGYGRGDYFIIKNEEEELWVTQYGTVFHRNKLE